MLVGENERVRLDHQTLDRLTTLPGNRVSAKQAGVLDQLGATQSLQHRIDLADVHRAAKWPAAPVRAAADGVEIVVERVEGIAL